MAQRGRRLERKNVGDKLCCSICLDLLKDPVTLPCGHNYCMNCIKRHWDEEDQKHIHSCPQCRQTFIPRPALVKNTMLAELVEEMKKTGLQPDVACDVCTGRKLKAIKSCLQCLVSYCEQHLRPHYNVAALKKHILVSPSENLQENICTNHNEVMKIFCRTDQQCICYLCSIDEHRDHYIVSAATEKNERQKELKLCHEKIHQKIKDREEYVMVFQQRMEAINYSANEAVRDSEKIFNELMLLIEKRSSDIKQQIRSQQETELNRTRELLQQVQQELSELKRKDVQLEELSHTEDLIRFLHTFPSLSYICESTLYKAPRITLSPMAYFKDVVGAVSEMKDELQRMLSDRWQKRSQTVTNVRVCLPQAKPKTTFSNTIDDYYLNDDELFGSQYTGYRTPPSADLKRSSSRRAGGEEEENLSISAETADPEHAICPHTFTRPPPAPQNLQEIVCPRHNEVMKIFCRTDQKCICYLCPIDEHKGHETVPASEERTERQRELNPCRGKIQERIQEREKDVNGIQQEVEAINHSADKAVRHTEKLFNELILLIQKRCSDIKQQIRTQQETEVNRAKELVEDLEEEITQLNRKDVELEKLSHTEDHTQFLNMFPSLTDLSESSESRCPTPRPLRYFNEVEAAVSEMNDILQSILQKGWKKI
ncbi:E3 ubiquitin/ISG15 ligase TRIM25-like [Archocentrus centrarchus]|uniref:E3 ubiquitin/ISG15 ligase TRIM25-like n=1 Tax=Archocentrus centrarchus TaxID=63155 RepID=UPI0011EA4DB2|nr:E3 ubiquitin/ISG15 ligase TRIM25-like [Archocentrus centrarchus]